MAYIEIYRIDSDVRETDESSAQPTDIESQQALVVGVDVYATGFRPLNNAANDARAVARVIKEEYGFSLLPNGDSLLNATATFDEIKNAIQDSLASANARTRWLFYFAGHGLVDDGRMYLLPSSAEKGSPKSYLALSWLLERCQQSQAAEILLILDACFSGWAMVRSEESAALDDRTPTPLETRVRQLISSGNPLQPVLDAGGAGHSVFTQALLDSLEGYSGVHESDGRIRFAPLLDQLSLEIPQRLRAAGLKTYQQQPIGGYFSGNNARRGFVLCPNVPRLPPDTIRDLSSPDPGRRVAGLKRLKSVAENQALELALAAQAIQMATQRLLSGPSDTVTRTVQIYEADPLVRAQAANTLGDLLFYLLERFKAEYPELAISIERLLEQIGTASPLFDAMSQQGLRLLDDLLEFSESNQIMEATRLNIMPALQGLLRALDDDPVVTRAVAAVLGRLALPITVRPLLECFMQAPDDLFLDLAGAIGAIGQAESTTAMLREALRRGKLVLFIGPDLPQALTGVPNRATFTADFARYEGITSPTSLAQVAETVTRGGQHRNSLVSALKNAYGNPLQQPGRFYAALKSLDAPFWLSACYDNLLAKSLDANTIVMGEDTNWRSGRPTVVRLVGDPDHLRGLVVLEKDYELLRENEGDRKLLLGFLQQELQGKVVLFLGFDPSSPDFDLLTRHVLNHHLAGTLTQIFLVWHTPVSALQWSAQHTRVIQKDELELIKQLSISST
jgi:hypothetical protein